MVGSVPGERTEQVPKRFGKYSLLHRIAVGGMAEIFIARHTGMQGFSRKIVIKKIRPHLSKEQSFINMFLNEAKLAAQLSHSNIAQIYDLGRIEQSYFIAMEYVRGRDMRAVTNKAEKKKIPFPLEYALKVAADTCEGLFYAHRRTDDTGRPLNIVHRDVTPENIMASFDGEVKILDFGIAKAENLATETKVGEIKGKLGYMSPEQIMGKSLDHRSDLFSLGVVLYEWLTGKKLFSAKNDVDVLRNVVEGKIYPPSYFRQEIPKAVEEIVMKALERNRQQRYQSAWEMQFDIRQFLSNHEFNPSNIHLSNFIRQIFAEDIRRDEAILSKAELEAEKMEPEGEATASFVVDETDESEYPESSHPAAKSRKTTSSIRRLVSPNKQETGSEPDPLVAELLATKEGHLSVTLEIERGQYEKLREIANRNNLSVPAFIREVMSQYIRFL